MPEIEHDVRIAKVEINPQLEELCAVWRRIKVADAVYIAHYYSMIRDAAGGLRYSAKDVETFSIALSAYQRDGWFPYKAGLFLSALINISKEDEFVIHTTHLAEPVHYLGIYNTKRISVHGDAGMYAGNLMKSGTMIVDGNTDFRLGCDMKGGCIILKGDTGNEVGSRMADGSIVVEGNAHDFVGAYMDGGEITIGGNTRGLGHHMRGGRISINGNFEFISTGQMISGKIFHKGELIVEK